MPINPQITYSCNQIMPAMAPELAKTIAVSIAANQVIPAGTVLGQQSATAADAVQTLTISGSPTGGTYSLLFQGQQTAPLAYNANAAAIQTALSNLENIGTGNVAVTGTGPFVITFGGALADEPQPLIQAISALTGGSSPVATVANTTTGETAIAYAAYNSSNTDGTQTARAIAMYDMATDDGGNITFGLQTGGGDQRETYQNAPVWALGAFFTQDLTGLDSGAVTSLGRLIEGTITSGILEVR